jgi:hypothetical protein
VKKATSRAKGLTQKQAAARAGVGPTSVHRWIAQRKIVPNPDGTIPPEAVDAMVKLREEKADSDEELDKTQASTKQRLLEAQASEREAKAELRVLEAKHARGEYVLRAEVETTGRQIGEQVRAALLALPARVALQVENLAAQPRGARAPAIEALIADEVNHVLEALHGSVYAAAGGSA